MTRLAPTLVTLDGDWIFEPKTPPRAILPGAFNPVHAGHWGLAEAASRMLGVAVDFELSLRNVDKPEISEEETRRRVVPFHGRAPIWLTRAPRFADKAELFPGATFIVGADTAARVVDSAYYADDVARWVAALVGIRERGCRFLVAARAMNGHLLLPSDLPIPAEFADLFVELPGFRLDMSSSALRSP